MDKSIKGGEKKTYSAPTLTAYGTVQQLTQKIAGRGKADGRVVGRTIFRTSL